MTARASVPVRIDGVATAFGLCAIRQRCGVAPVLGTDWRNDQKKTALARGPSSDGVSPRHTARSRRAAAPDRPLLTEVSAQRATRPTLKRGKVQLTKREAVTPRARRPAPG